MGGNAYGRGYYTAFNHHNIRHLLERARVSSEESGVGCDVIVVA